MGTTRKQDKTEVRFLGSVILLVAALGAFVALLYHFAPENKTPIEQTLAYDALQQTQPRLPRTRAERRRTSSQQQEMVEHEQVASAEVASVPSDSVPAAVEPENNEALERAIELIDSGNPDEALTILEQIISQDPNNERALIEISMVHLIDYRNAAAAVPWLERSLQVSPANRMVLAELVAIYSEQDNVGGGMSFLQGLQEKANKEDASYISLGMGQLLVADGREDEAVLHLERAAEGLPNDANILAGLADTYARSGNSDRAIDTYQKAADAREAEINKLPADDKRRQHKQKQHIRILIQIVREYSQRGEFDAALEQLEEIKKRYATNIPQVAGLIANLRRQIALRRAG